MSDRMDIDSDGSSQSNELRITSQGKIGNWVTYALQFFEVSRIIHQFTSTFTHGDPPEQKNPNAPLTLHTLPYRRPAPLMSLPQAAMSSRARGSS